MRDMLMITIFSNEYYQLGDGTTQIRGDEIGEMGEHLTPVDLSTDFVPIDIEAGAQHVCVMSDSNAVKCWGTKTLCFFLQLFREQK